MTPYGFRILARTAVGAALAALSILPGRAAGPRFYTDDPIAREPESQNAAGAQPEDIGLFYDLAFNSFVTAERKPSGVHAQNVNTIDEVPDSGWFTNRVLADRPLSAEDLTRGPNQGTPPNPERWTVVREKSAGAAPGFTARDANGETWFLSFDPPTNPEGASAAAVIATKIFWALGYNQIDTYITSVDPRHLAIDPKATSKRPNGKRTRMTQDDVDAILERAARNADGTYRAAAGRLLPGTVLGPFRYEGTRPDDPNDTVPHEHRRELRALRVFGAWTNLTDLKAGNTLDTLIPLEGRSVVRHYLQDVGSTFGIGANGPHDWDEGFEHFFQSDATWRRLLSFGFALSPWQTASYEIYPSVGRFESEAFDPVKWHPHWPTQPYVEMDASDAFWAARRVAAFDDDMVRAIVHTGQFSDASAERHLAAVLIARRDKVARAYLGGVNPIVNPALGADGRLTFENAAVANHAGAAPAGYHVTWTRFDNATGERHPLLETDVKDTAIQAPSPLPDGDGAFLEVDINALPSAPDAWRQPVRIYFKRSGGGWILVGLERTGNGSPQAPGQKSQ